MASSKTVQMSKLGKELFALARAFGNEGQKAMVDAARMGKRAAVAAIGTVKGDFKGQPVDTGEMRRSYVVSKIQEGAKLENVAPHSAFMEFGTRPHFAPIQPLLEWARRKVRGGKKSEKKKGVGTGSPRTKKTGNRKVGASGPGSDQSPARIRKQKDREAAAKKLAYGARKSIAADGTEARGFHAEASKQFPKLQEDALLKRLRRVK